MDGRFIRIFTGTPLGAADRPFRQFSGFPVHTGLATSSLPPMNRPPWDFSRFSVGDDDQSRGPAPVFQTRCGTRSRMGSAISITPILAPPALKKQCTPDPMPGWVYSPPDSLTEKKIRTLWPSRWAWATGWPTACRIKRGAIAMGITDVPHGAPWSRIYSTENNISYYAFLSELVKNPGLDAAQRRLFNAERYAAEKLAAGIPPLIARHLPCPARRNSSGD